MFSSKRSHGKDAHNASRSGLRLQARERGLMGNIRDGQGEPDTTDGLRRDRDLESCQLSNDCLDLLRCIDIPIVTVGTDLRILHFTGAAVKVLNLAAHHLGAPMSVGSSNFDSEL